MPDPARDGVNLRHKWLWGQIDASGDCWEWTGRTNTGGYGNISYYGKTWQVHRLVYTMLVGVELGDLQLDHLCQNPRCCNPDHLEPVTSEENMARARKSRGRGDMRRCHRGHLNQWMTDSRGKVVCRACGLERVRKHREQKKQTERRRGEDLA